MADYETAKSYDHLLDSIEQLTETIHLLNIRIDKLRLSNKSINEYHELAIIKAALMASFRPIKYNEVKVIFSLIDLFESCVVFIRHAYIHGALKYPINITFEKFVRLLDDLGLEYQTFKDDKDELYIGVDIYVEKDLDPESLDKNECVKLLRYHHHLLFERGIIS